ncbi:hypothetical protein ACFOSC_22955 [Streptantibioticus rubrisoli]|uniref:Uncharacterized protein n=1 Tax=Streptantibioticus rubrisoli TaxID=1387313 RepID=A0ABT1PFE8_9ACTN|nr:hypothetical protein [Streptantibioticus rubrisoli]MCQ4043188.1 hypothetical protein [Streptantibioticus rubrisoli]
MIVTRALAATAAAGAALGLAAPLAAAAAGPATPSASSSAPSYGSNSVSNNITVTPSDVRPGGTLTITVAGTSCRGSGRPYNAVVESSVFSRTPLKGINQGSSVATVKVLPTAKNGAYKVTATCAGKSITGGDFTVGDIAVKGDPPRGVARKLGALVKGARSRAMSKGGEGMAAAPTTAPSMGPNTAPGMAPGAAPSSGPLTKGAKTGLGGSHDGVNTVQAALGATLLAAAVTGGGVYLVRRRAGSKY